MFNGLMIYYQFNPQIIGLITLPLSILGVILLLASFYFSYQSFVEEYPVNSKDEFGDITID